MSGTRPPRRSKRVSGPSEIETESVESTVISTPVLASSSISQVKIETISPNSGSFTSLRRVTRSVTTPTTPTSIVDSNPSSSAKPLNLDTYAYVPPTTSTSRRKRVKVERDDTPLQEVKQEPQTPNSKGKGKAGRPPLTPKSSSKKALPLLALEKPHPAPAKWEEQYRLIERMRKGIVAPVDDMGCERPRNVTKAEPKTLRFHTLISLMLSAQTKDAITSQAVTNLHQTLPGGLTAESLAAASVETVHECINKVGFWRRKTEYIQEAAKHLLLQEGERRGDVPDTLEGLCELKGVGPKMAFLALQCAWDINAGIGVDVHVHRITNRLKWHKPPTLNAEQTRLNLQSWLPKELHKSINPMLVGFGQVICLPVGPRCDLCLLGQRKLCPSRNSNVKAEGRKEVHYTFTAEDDVKIDVKVETNGDGSAPQEVGAKLQVGYEEEVSPDTPTKSSLGSDMGPPGIFASKIKDLLF